MDKKRKPKVLSRSLQIIHGFAHKAEGTGSRETLINSHSYRSNNNTGELANNQPISVIPSQPQQGNTSLMKLFDPLLDDRLHSKLP